MARMPRIVVPDVPHHVTQRGNRRMQTFFGAEDYDAYLGYLSESTREAGTQVWAYCLMPNHVHFILVPSDKDGLRATFAEAHRLYTRRVNFREGWRGHLWQERFHSFPMDEVHLYQAVRYVERNPVAAKICSDVLDWQWSSARAHVAGCDDALCDVAPMLSRVANWRAYLETGIPSVEREKLQSHSRTGRPLGDEAFVTRVEGVTGRDLSIGKPGPKPKKAVNRE